MEKVSKKKVAYRKRTQNRFSMILVVMVVCLITIAVGMRSVEINRRIAEKDVQIEQLQEQILAEQKRSDEIEEFRKRSQTKQYYEEVAKEKLGLVYEGELVFQQEK
ncbi:MAG: septum formation initiator family protein [Lachnospiraceae bacterium]|nr:septum formation initiator family protein [Lachnospiraceae bacterium]